MPAQEKAAAPVRVPKSAEREPTALDAANAAMPAQTVDTVSEDVEPSRRAGFVRQPFGAMGLKLNAPVRPGYHRHWFNDVLDRIQQAVAAGYTHVKEEGTQVPKSRVVGVAKGGGPQLGYLMEIPEQWFKEDMAAHQRKVDEIDAALRGGNIARKENDERYIPSSGIKIADGGIVQEE